MCAMSTDMSIHMCLTMCIDMCMYRHLQGKAVLVRGKYKHAVLAGKGIRCRRCHPEGKTTGDLTYTRMRMAHVSRAYTLAGF